MFLLGYDLGSSSIKAALVEAKSRKTIAISQYPRGIVLAAIDLYIVLVIGDSSARTFLEFPELKGPFILW